MIPQPTQGECNADRLKRVVVFGNGMLPLYRHGDQLLVSGSAPLKIGDRVLLQTGKHGTLGGTLVHRDDKRIVISMGGTAKKSCSIESLDVEFLGRIVWASQ